MCGIVGIFNTKGTPADDAPVLTRMRDAMLHRGPDDGGLYQSPDRRVTLGQRRLSIVDLSTQGHQPMANEDGTVWITFNGEIYNHEPLRERLLKQGHVFRSLTDTEAIIHLYEELGVECIQHLDGMFAFGIWDERKRRLVLARDRMGKKPLYYTVADGRLLFASEIKALLEHPAVSRELDLQALNQYLTFGDVPAPLTLFTGIFKLPPAHFMVWDESGTQRVQRFWSPLDGEPWSDTADEGAAVERVRHLLKQSVAKRLMADVPVGAFLSGGIDSTANVALMSELVSEPLRTFTIGFEGFAEAENFHDLPYARRAAEHFGCIHHEVKVTAQECRDLLPRLAYQQDEPVADPACIPMHFVSKAAKDGGVTVVLAGEGSDEVFGGYGDMAQVRKVASGRWAQLCGLPKAARMLAYHATRLSGAPAGRVDLVRRAAMDEPLYWGLEVVYWDYEKGQLLQPHIWDQMGRSTASVVQRFYDEIGERQPGADMLQRMSYVEICNRLPELLLMRVDKLSMAHSLEVRAPFLDHELVSYALSLPSALKIRGKETKRILKQALEPVLPHEIIHRPKQGFRVPLPEWLRGELSGWAEDLLFSSSLCKQDLFRPEYLRGMWQRHRAGVQDHSFDLWTLINLAAWYEHWIAA